MRAVVAAIWLQMQIVIALTKFFFSSVRVSFRRDFGLSRAYDALRNFKNDFYIFVIQQMIIAYWNPKTVIYGNDFPPKSFRLWFSRFGILWKLLIKKRARDFIIITTCFVWLIYVYLHLRLSLFCSWFSFFVVFLLLFIGVSRPFFVLSKSHPFSKMLSQTWDKCTFSNTPDLKFSNVFFFFSPFFSSQI